MNDTDGAMLRVVKFIDESGQPFTAYLGLDRDQFSDLIAQETFDLQPFAKHILSVVKSHDPPPDELVAARQAFAQNYTGVHSGNSGRSDI